MVLTLKQLNLVLVFSHASILFYYKQKCCNGLEIIALETFVFPKVMTEQKRVLSFMHVTCLDEWPLVLLMIGSEFMSTNRVDKW